MKPEVRRHLFAARSLLVLLAVLVPVVLAMRPAGEVPRQRAPRTLRAVPGEPMRLELTVRADSAAPLRVHVPRSPLLKLRAMEKLPVRRTPEGAIVHKRVIVWQGLEPGTVKMKTLSVMTRGQKLLLPEITITVCDPGP